MGHPREIHGELEKYVYAQADRIAHCPYSTGEGIFLEPIRKPPAQAKGRAKTVLARRATEEYPRRYAEEAERCQRRL
jgi:hypothetical protein